MNAIVQRLYLSPVTVPLRPALRRLRRSVLMPRNWLKPWRLLRILTVEYGYLRSVAAEMPLDGRLAPLPWYTYPAIEYLKQLDFHDKRVFEYGCGQSTLFWGQRAARVVSVEHDAAWYRRVREHLPETCELLLESDPEAYPRAIERFPDGFDVIVIDGLVTGRTRLKCAAIAARRLRPGGMIILDNSDWLPESSRRLREDGLIEVDMTGFAPINDYTCTTSFYFDRRFAFEPLEDRQPNPGIGARAYNWESGAMAERLAAARLGSER
jgi:methyltransferase family protein